MTVVLRIPGLWQFLMFILITLLILQVPYRTFAALPISHGELQTSWYDPNGCVVGGVSASANTRTYIVGDSIALGAKVELESEIPGVVINASESRSITKPGTTSGNQTSGIDAVESDRNAITGAGIVVISLGTNQRDSDFKQAMAEIIDDVQAINSEASIYWANVFSPGVSDKDTVNDAIEDIVQSERIDLINLTSGRAIAVEDDELHPTNDGKKTFAQRIADGVRPGNTASIDGSSSTTLGSLPPKSQAVFDAAKPAIDKMRPVYEAGAKSTGIPWEYLAAIHYREANNREGTSVFNGQPLGAANIDGQADTGGTNAEANAVRAAETFISLSKGVYGVDPTKDRSFEDLQKAFLAYNRGYIYQRVNASPDSSPYVMSGYDSGHALPMAWPSVSGEPLSGTDPRLGAMSILAGLGIGTSSGGSGGCSGGSAASSSSCEKIAKADNGFVFPLCTTKKVIKAGASNGSGTGIWCYKNRTTCHHDYAAADIHAVEGTMVIAAVGGTVYSADSPAACDGGFGVPRAQIKGEDNKYYYYTHMKPGSLTIKKGQKINAGDQIGVVGPKECAQGTAPHLHIHRGSGVTKCAGTSTCGQHADYDANDIQPDAYAAYEKLPEE